MSGGDGANLRLFVALELPAATRSALSGWAAQRLSGLDGVRVLAPEVLHVTLCFLGAIEAASVPEIEGAVGSAVAGHGSLSLTAEEAIALPRRRPRVVAVRIGGAGERALGVLQGALSTRLAAGGWYRPEARPFLAHVTVGRVRLRPRVDAGAVAGLGAVSGGGAAGLTAGAGVAPPFVADTVTLFRSHTRPGGAHYEPLARAVLVG